MSTAATGEAQTYTSLMRDVPLLARLADDDLGSLASRGQERSFQPGAIVFREGEPGDALYVVMDGRIRVSVLSTEGSEATLAFMDRGDCVGELALFDGGPRSATATAIEATRTFIVTRAEFADWLKSRPAAALALLETLSGRLRRTDEALADLCFLDLPQRLAKQLVRLAAQNPGSAGTSAKVRVTQAEIAGLLSVSRESVNKQLNQFVRDGWISLGRGWVRVDDVGALRRFA
ncbi:MAG TPA: Crp/Fnr family transcriptional regulator [Tepidiformaceae bacterium]|nr:Crp/Fnr family transcriptional regulator [Tepidiformaceae bacterium]